MTSSAVPGRRPGRAFFPGVEGLRAVAALLVLLVHVAFVAGVTPAPGAAGDFTARAEVGVGVFFVISGFLLYRPWVAAHLGGGPPPAVGRFLVRRVLRILPLYWVVLAATLLLVPTARPKDWLDAVLLPLLGQVYRDQTVYLGVPQAWSLCVELAFYLALPLYAWSIRRIADAVRIGRERVEWAGIAVLYVLGVGLRGLLEATSPVPFKVWHGFLPVWFDLFALGFALSVLSVRWSTGRLPVPSTRAWFPVACWIGAAATYLVLARGIGLGRDPLYERDTGQALAEQVLWGLFAVLLLLPAVTANPRVLTLRPVALLGLVSYGIYLWHQLVVESLLEHTGWDLFQVAFSALLPVVVVLTVALAAGSYLLVERPAIRLGHRTRASTQDRREQLVGVPAEPPSRQPG